MSTDNDLVARLRIRWDAMGDMANDERAAAATEIERLRAERDEARLQVCLLAAHIKHGNEYQLSKAMEIAELLGWDCFKEDTDD